jgi:cellulose synthase/poly-beta-1,6-N-acetylglucosamine synthase-like glycosyltransferase
MPPSASPPTTRRHATRRARALRYCVRLWPVLAVVAIGGAFGAWRALEAWPAIGSSSVPLGVRLLVTTQWFVEMLFALGIAGTLVVALSYSALRKRPPEPPPHPDSPGLRIAILYLCCGDLDEDAVQSLLQLDHDGPIELWIHDDKPGGDHAVDRLVERVRDAAMPVHLLRRPIKDGGKPGAINWVLQNAPGHADFVLLCDNDSIAVDPMSLRRLLAPMVDPAVAVVQARNVPVLADDQCSVNRIASSAIDVFDLFLTVGSRIAWMPFVGHNALLRLDAIRQVGGMQPGCFADDIDLTLRLQLVGHRVVYAPDVAFGERHPPSYAAFRKRAYKWACGSVQVLKAWTWRVLASRRLHPAEKWGYLQFLGFFPLQALALLYTCLAFLVAPFVLSREWSSVVPSFLAGSILPLLIFLPVLAYAARRRISHGLPLFLLTCWAVYGAADVPTARGVLHGFGRRPRRWVPTNSVRGGADGSMFAEALFGAALLVLPLAVYPDLLLSPLTLLVATKFLLIPTIGELYQDGTRLGRSPRRLPAAVSQLLRLGSVLLVSGALVSQSPQTTRSVVTVEGEQLLVDGMPYVVRGVHYGPWRPGTGPGRSNYPSRAELEEDLALIEGLGANSIFTFDAPRLLLDVAWEHHVRVLCGFWLEWPQFADAGFAEYENRALAAVHELHDHPAVLGWVLGNEIPSWVVTQFGPDVVSMRLRHLHARVRAIDSAHPVTHANWPTTRTLDLSFLEICAFNVYALWPPEVVARGYGNFVRDVIRPLAGGRPLLITEFGANALEAGLDGQGRLATECWQGLRSAGAVGGFVFEFADEWWKNYSNPKMEGAWWDRDTDLNDHLRHDEDPEEHYGLFDGTRRPKPASRAVRAMYGGDADGEVAGTSASFGSGSSLAVWIVVGTVGGALVLYLATVRMRMRDRQRANALRAESSLDHVSSQGNRLP